MKHSSEFEIVMVHAFVFVAVCFIAYCVYYRYKRRKRRKDSHGDGGYVDWSSLGDWGDSFGDGGGDGCSGD